MKALDYAIFNMTHEHRARYFATLADHAQQSLNPRVRSLVQRMRWTWLGL